MKPAVFDYHSPSELKEALHLLNEFGYDAKIMSGGQSLIPMMNMRLARPKVVIDINQIKELNYIRINNSVIQIGGLTRHYQIEESKEIEQVCRLITEGMKLIGHSQIRSRGTIGGSVVHADPTAELPVMLSTLGATITLASAEGQRTVTTEEFFMTYLTTTIEMNEILVSVEIPIPPANTGYAIDEFTLRKGDFAIVLAAASVTLDVEGKVKAARLALGGVDGVPVLLDEVTDGLIGKIPDQNLIAECCMGIGDMVDPEPDIHASAEYRRDLCITYAKRVLELAAKRALKQQP
ncbi:xanthine dehydrogenase family protein subunit M [Peribacillus saganii]|uniref:Xanthine dehydrogenase family protein subunit M n=1 Tax=Peribacillus saganii TaxID=2303992 RepID=A0A372LQM9_9BACI|nr:FAD binding domain-containing protein [Peribacillus saganii]RFU70529.1 xanthine dehydrogenase family protein subunit M [Peribacillus saganii]